MLKPEGKGGVTDRTVSRPVRVKPVRSGPTSRKGLRRPKPPTERRANALLGAATTAAAVLLRREAAGAVSAAAILTFLRDGDSGG